MAKKTKILIYAVYVLALTCYLYFGFLMYLYAQEYKKDPAPANEPAVNKAQEQVASTTASENTDAYLADYTQTLKSEEPKADAAAKESEIAQEALADISESISAQEAEAAVKQGAAGDAIVVNGDNVEYATEAKEVTARGNVVIDYKGSKLSCDRIVINTAAKLGEADGNVKLDDARGVIKGSKISYNFFDKTGTIYDADFITLPYFGKARKLEKVSATQFTTLQSCMTTCNFDHPHYRFEASQLDVIPQERIVAENMAIYIGNIPVMYLPRFARNFSDPIMHIQTMPGSSKDWGFYLLNTWRTNLAQDLNAQVYLDYRNKLGFAEGFGLNYASPSFGKSDFKFYYTDENPKDKITGAPDTFQRYLVRWRHQWDIDPATNVVVEFYKISDEKRKYDSEVNILKDYFYREYEKDSQPLSYAFFHHAFPNSTFDFLMQERTNHWYDQLSKTPEARYSLPGFKLGVTPLYFDSNTDVANFDKKASMAPVSGDEVDMARLDTTNKLLLPLKVAFLELTPFIANRETIYDKGADGATLPIRTIFYGGMNLSTKFYRLFDIKSNFLGMDINGLRHVMTPTVQYTYTNEPTIESSDLKQIDDVDAITKGSVVEFGLSNKLQTKRNGRSVDLFDLYVSSSYEFKPRMVDGEKSGGALQDIFFKLKVLPYSWMRLQADSAYNAENGYFSEGNYDINFDIGKDRSFGFGQRYARSNSNQLTTGFTWRFTPKWKFSAYDRYEFGNGPNLVRGLAEQQYIITRDLHCWEMDLAFDRKKEEGSTIWVVFRLKAFPELEFGFDQSYQGPGDGSQSN